MFNMTKRSRMIYFGVIAFLMISELITANIYSLFFALEKTAELMGVPVDEERIRLVILIFLDAIPGLGAVLAVRAYRGNISLELGRKGVIITTIGLLAYGLYQLWAATFLLGFMPTFHQGVGIFYASLGVISWFVGEDMRKKQL